jgi:hypothetical protein
MKNTITKSVLVLASTGVLGIVYTPTPRTSKPHKEFIERTYIRSTYKDQIYASELRKREILANIRSIRREMKLQSELHGKSIHTPCTGELAESNTEVNCSKLMLSIVNNLS